MIYDALSVMYDRNHKGHATARGALYLKHWRKYEIVMREVLMIESKQIQSDQCDIPAQKQPPGVDGWRVALSQSHQKMRAR